MSDLFSPIENPYFLSSGEKYYLYSNDVQTNQILKYKTNGVVYLFTDNLKKLFVFNNNNSPVIYLSPSESDNFENILFIQRQQLSGKSFIYSKYIYNHFFLIQDKSHNFFYFHQ